MIRFDCDYTEGAHPTILDALAKTNMEQTAGYGMDPHCRRARKLIMDACDTPHADVHFLVGGTQANTTVINAILRPYQGVLSADTGHINVHETGAIEATGHKVITLPNKEGKITAEQVQKAYESHYQDATHEHMVQPAMVYISHPTEFGTLYTLEELKALHQVCQSCQMPLFLDGARLGYGLMAKQTDITLQDIARMCDVFYIGGTKVGALFGEAIVITNPALKKDFRYMIKRHGGMLAKGRILGIQFETLFENGLYTQIAKEAIHYAMEIKAAFIHHGFELYADSFTNQQFPILSEKQMIALEKKYIFSRWEKLPDARWAVRFCTSWATQKEQVNALIQDIENL